MAQAQTTLSPPPAPPTFKKITEDRCKCASFIRGETLIVTLPGDEKIDEGVQDVNRWSLVGPRLCMHQQLEVTNDTGSMWRWMRVSKIHGGPGSGLRALVLEDIVPPKFYDLSETPIVATGDWQIAHGGPHKRWQVISPTGVVKHEGVNTEEEARLLRNSEERDPKPR